MAHQSCCTRWWFSLPSLLPLLHTFLCKEKSVKCDLGLAKALLLIKILPLTWVSNWSDIKKKAVSSPLRRKSELVLHKTVIPGLFHWYQWLHLCKKIKWARNCGLALRLHGTAQLTIIRWNPPAHLNRMAICKLPFGKGAWCRLCPRPFLATIWESTNLHTLKYDQSLC